MIQEDKFGNVWIGNYSSGLDFISHNQSNFHIIPYFYEIGETKIRKRIYGVKANPDGTVWLGGENELSLYDGHQISRRVNLSTYMYRSYSVIYTIEKIKTIIFGWESTMKESCATIHKKTFSAMWIWMWITWISVFL